MGRDLFDIAMMKKFVGGSGGGGVSSWNDLADKPFGEVDDAVLLPPTQFAFDDAFGLFAVPGYIAFLEGKTYTVNWNGVEYTTEGVVGQFNGENLVVIGNPAALGGANNNLPFAIACLMGAIGAIPLDGSTSVNVGIRGYLLTKIPVKYLPRMVVDARIETENGTVEFNDGYGSPIVIETPGVTNAAIADAAFAGGDVIVRARITNYVREGIVRIYYPYLLQYESFGPSIVRFQSTGGKEELWFGTSSDPIAVPIS